MMRFIRWMGGGLGVILAISLLSYSPSSDVLFDPTPGGRLLLGAWVAAWFVVGFAIMPYVTVVPAQRIAHGVTRVSSGEFLAAIAGLLIGLLMGLLLGLPMANLPDPYGWLLPLGVSIVLGFGMMGLTVAKRFEIRDALVVLLGARREEAPGAEGGESASLVSYVNTSAIIDGRLVNVVSAGFLFGKLIVPRFVLGELQGIADDPDPGRRTRGRRGLEILSVLQKDHRVGLDLTDEDAPGTPAVDAKLVALARSRGAAILTTDYNLNRVAQLQGVRVMNLNQLANAMKPAFLPGDAMHVKVIQQGKEPGQGVAFLDDGTMIVVEGGGSFLHRELDVTVTRVLQTVAGRMVFAQPAGGA